MSPARLLREEDEAQAGAFLAAGPGFALMRASSVWRELQVSPGGDRDLFLTPARHGTDGLYVAVLERRGDNEALLALRNQPGIAPRFAGTIRGSAARRGGPPPCIAICFPQKYGAVGWRRKVAVINMKGGVGKGTLCINLAWHFAVMEPWDKKVLAGDLDFEFNASQYMLEFSGMQYEIYR